MTPTGTIVFSSGAGLDFDIWSLNLNNGELKQLTHGEDLNDHPRWSPDGRSIVYLSTQQDSISSIWIMDHDGGRKRRLTSDISCQYPSWSPDGREILFLGNAVDRSELDICTIPIDGGAPRTLFSSTAIEHSPSWCPDGSRIIFASSPAIGSSPNSRDTEIVCFDTSTSQTSVLASHPAKDYGPVCSPSGDRIAFISHRKARSAEEILNAYREYREILTHGSNSEGRAAMQRMKNFESDGDIFVANADGSDARQLTHDSAMDKSLCWSPCGDYLMYTAAPRSDTGGERLKIINSSTGEAVPFRYDRRAFEAEIQSERLLNQTIFQKLIPDALERLFLDHSFFGEERNPHWKA